MRKWRFYEKQKEKERRKKAGRGDKLSSEFESKEIKENEKMRELMYEESVGKKDRKKTGLGKKSKVVKWRESKELENERGKIGGKLVRYRKKKRRRS